MVIFVGLDMKHNTQISTLYDFSHNIYFYCWKKLKKHYLYFHSKMAWPPPTYEVISRSPRNWPLLNLTQNAPVRWTNSYWTRQVLMFYPLGENSDQQNLRGVASTPTCTSEGWNYALIFYLTKSLHFVQVHDNKPNLFPLDQKRGRLKTWAIEFSLLATTKLLFVVQKCQKKISTEMVAFFPLAAAIWYMPHNLYICVVLQLDYRHGQFLDIRPTDLSHTNDFRRFA